MSIEYPPLTSLDVMPLHPEQGDPPVTYACQGGESHDWRCPDCVAAAAAMVARGEDPFQSWRQSPGADPVGVTLSWLVERSRTLLAQPPA